jgi:hypothetical protein
LAHIRTCFSRDISGFRESSVGKVNPDLSKWIGLIGQGSQAELTKWVLYVSKNHHVVIWPTGLQPL